MLVSYRFKNGYSFSESAEVSFQVGKKPAITDYDIHLTSTPRLNKVLAVVGPNGSGKTQLLKPMAFLSWFIDQSFLSLDPDADIPYQPHAFQRDQDSEFEVHFLMDEQEYKYQLALNNGRVVHESLHRKTSRLFSYLFVREKKADGFHYKQQHFGFSAPQATQIRDNVSLISAAHSFDVPLAAEICDFFSRFSCNVRFRGRANFNQEALLECGKYFSKGPPELLKTLEEVLRKLDMGLNGIRISETELQDEQGQSRKIQVPIGLHQSDKGRFELPFFEESSGTQSALVLLRRIMPVLIQGGVAVIDEIDNDLHPLLLPAILEMFRFEHTNPHQAQLIFSCHTPEVLNLLGKHQVYLVEKQDHSSTAWRLDEMVGLRADDNRYAKYMAGALGAVPEM